MAVQYLDDGVAANHLDRSSPSSVKQLWGKKDMNLNDKNPE